MSRKYDEISKMGLVKQQSPRYTIDFNQSGELVQDYAFTDVKVKRILTNNVSKLFVSYKNVIRKEIDLTNIGELKIPADTLIIWEILREVENNIASIGIETK